jgi:hypothetical protein
MKRGRSVLCQSDTVNKSRDAFAHPNLAGRKRKSDAEGVQEIAVESEIKKTKRNKVHITN